MKKKIVIAAAAAAVICAISVAFALILLPDNKYGFTVDAVNSGDPLPNLKSHINCFGGRFPENPVINEEYNPYEFTDYIQLMECTGGAGERDCFVSPDDYTTLTDYDFSGLIYSCRGILKTGAKPLLKLGNVPAKLSRSAIETHGFAGGDFGMNVYPPDDYGEYYDYIKAAAEALCDEFGREEVELWRFGVLTEYENKGWFRTPDEDPGKTLEAYCMLYDYTVQALIDTIGENVFVGAHSMSCSEGLFDERDFIRHCGEGVNYATGEKGTRINYLSASYYELRPGEETTNYTIPEIISTLRDAAESVGLDNLIYGVDEGRVLYGNNSGTVAGDLNSRTVGYTWQAAFDARLAKQMFDTGMNYFSSWEYCSNPGNSGNPLITYHISKLLSEFTGMRYCPVTETETGNIKDADVNVSAAVDPETGAVRLMAYNYKNSLKYRSTAQISVDLVCPTESGTADVTVYTIDDDCNWFDEWESERESLGFGDDAFSWSPDDGCPLFTSDEYKEKYMSLGDRYAQYCRLEPETYQIETVGGHASLELTIKPNTVVFMLIKGTE